jgi:hypothetical protein
MPLLSSSLSLSPGELLVARDAAAVEVAAAHDEGPAPRDREHHHRAPRQRPHAHHHLPRAHVQLRSLPVSDLVDDEHEIIRDEEEKDREDIDLQDPCHGSQRCDSSRIQHLVLGLGDGSAHAGHDDHGGVRQRAEHGEEQAADEPGVHHLRITV